MGLASVNKPVVKRKQVKVKNKDFLHFSMSCEMIQDLMRKVVIMLFK